MKNEVPSSLAFQSKWLEPRWPRQHKHMMSKLHTKIHTKEKSVAREEGLLEERKENKALHIRRKGIVSDTLIFGTSRQECHSTEKVATRTWWKCMFSVIQEFRRVGGVVFSVEMLQSVWIVKVVESCWRLVVACEVLGYPRPPVFAALEPTSEVQNRQSPAWVVNIKMGAKLSETIERWASLGTGERTMTEEEREEEVKQSNGKMQRENFVNTDWSSTWRALLESPWTRDDRDSRYLQYLKDQAVFAHGSLASWHNELFRQESVGRRAFLSFLLNGTSTFCSRVLRQSCNHRERRSIEIHTCCRQGHDCARFATLKKHPVSQMSEATSDEKRGFVAHACLAGVAFYHLDACAGSVQTPHDYITNVRKRLGNRSYKGIDECRLCGSFLRRSAWALRNLQHRRSHPGALLNALMLSQEG